MPTTAIDLPTPAGTSVPAHQALIAGLVGLAVFLQEHPDLPANGEAEVLYCVPGDTDADGLATIAAIATAIGVPVTDVAGRPAGSETTHFYARRRFGPVCYKAAYIQRSEMADHDALMSYSGVIRADRSDDAR